MVTSQVSPQIQPVQVGRVQVMGNVSNYVAADSLPIQASGWPRLLVTSELAFSNPPAPLSKQPSNKVCIG